MSSQSIEWNEKSFRYQFQDYINWLYEFCKHAGRVKRFYFFHLKNFSHDNPTSQFRRKKPYGIEIIVLKISDNSQLQENLEESLVKDTKATTKVEWPSTEFQVWPDSRTKNLTFRVRAKFGISFVRLVTICL